MKLVLIQAENVSYLLLIVTGLFPAQKHNDSIGVISAISTGCSMAHSLKLELDIGNQRLFEWTKNITIIVMADNEGLFSFLASPILAVHRRTWNSTGSNAV